MLTKYIYLRDFYQRIDSESRSQSKNAIRERTLADLYEIYILSIFFWERGKEQKKSTSMCTLSNAENNIPQLVSLHILVFQNNQNSYPTTLYRVLDLCTPYAGQIRMESH